MTTAEHTGRRPAGGPARRHRAHHGRRPHGPHRRRRPRRRRPDRRRRPGARRARGHAGDRRVRRHRDAGHDRHPPAHVADRDARVRRRLDADPVLRLVLPRARQDVPARGHLRRQPDVGLGGARGRASPRRSTGPTGCRPSTTPRRPWTRCRPSRAGSSWPTATSRPARGSGPPTRRCRRSSSAGCGPTTGSASSSPSTSPVTRRSRSGPPSRWPASSGSPVTTHAGVWGATNDDGIRLMHENGFMTPETVYVHAATLSADSYQRIAATGGSVSVSTESEQSAGQGYPPTWQVRRYGIPVSLSMDTSVWWSGDLFSRDADDARRRPVPRAPRGPRQGRHRDHSPPARRAGRRLGHPRRRAGARPRRPRQPRARARRPTWC